MKLNKKYFEGVLPKDTKVLWSTNLKKLYNYEGVTLHAKGHPSLIIIDSSMRKLNNLHILVMLHEMIHLKILTMYPRGRQRHHGPAFKREKRQLEKAGALTFLW